VRTDILIALVSGGIPTFGGIVVLLYGYGVWGKGPRWDDWRSRYGRTVKILGPLLVAFGVYRVVVGTALAMWTPAVDWQRHATVDGVCSAEFPQLPQREVKDSAGKELHRLGVHRQDIDAYYSLSVEDIQPQPGVTDEERLDGALEAMSQLDPTMTKDPYEFVSEEKIGMGKLSGRQWVFKVGTHRLRTKVFILNYRLYRQMAVVPGDKPDDAQTQRFMNSLQFLNSIQ